MAAEDLGNLEWERSKISQQDINMLKKLGISGKQDAIRFPKEESYPAPPMQYRVSFVDHLIRGLSTPIHVFLRGLLFMYGLQLHHLIPNSILDISIFITLCESFLGIQPNWSLWKRIFLCHRNGSSSVAYNIGGVVICVRPTSNISTSNSLIQFKGGARNGYTSVKRITALLKTIFLLLMLSRKFVAADPGMQRLPTQKKRREALMTRIHELQNTRGQELSGIQITAYFLRIRVQPLQARKNPLWMYAGDKDVDRLSVDLSVNDLAKLVRKISSLNKKDSVPTSCGVTPYSATNALPQNHGTASPLPPLSEGGEVEERAVVTDDNQTMSRPESEAAFSRKSAASSEKDAEAEATSSTRSPPSAASPRSKRKRDEAVDTGTSKAGASLADKTAPNAGEETLDLYDAALVSSDDEEEDAPIDETARTSTSRTLVVSEARPDGGETSPPPQNLERSTPATSPRAPSPKRARVESSKETTILVGSSSTPLMEEPFMKELVRFGTQFIGYRDHAGELEEKLAEANRRADALTIELEQSKSAHTKTVEDLQKRLDDAKKALEENVTQHSAREKEILSRLETQSRRFVRRTHQEYELDNPEDDELLDALSLLEIHVFIDLAKCFTGNEDLGLQLRQEGLKVGVEGTMALVAESQQQVDWSKVGDAGKIETKRWQSLIKAAKPNSKKILATLGYKPTTAPSSSKPEVK
ncbi:hypothetical protein QYE76_021634 [Lolium multiflorum]|uniref:Transposase (putative) gypsy type domain-containing protein n=1 Tax=Lolium multiflorum TaxID=4521 RepID=A0AAD8R830_LOLMU|nr:hypothetical protein QYE76_021634 [Lolium multiflorum]